MQAKKSYGQHFLNRPEIALRIAEGLTLTNEYPRVIEVGPGQGMLTQYLLHKPYEVICVEADKDMVGVLEKKFKNYNSQSIEKLGIIQEDFLKYDLKKAFGGQQFCLIGNFPYNISSQILFKMLDNKTLVPEMVGMFQKEVAERVVAKAGSKEYGILSLLCQAFYSGKILFNVDKSCFSPPPKVQSAVIRLERKAQQDLGCDEKMFKNVVKMAFNQRRKMLRNTLKSFFTDTPSVLEDPFFMKRPEQLSLEEFVVLTQRIQANRP
jgi:16S rRNA (adenine1518-N6/adenine1519-N6)-dimethyltransferase